MAGLFPDSTTYIPTFSMLYMINPMLLAMLLFDVSWAYQPNIKAEFLVRGKSSSYHYRPCNREITSLTPQASETPIFIRSAPPAITTAAAARLQLPCNITCYLSLHRIVRLVKKASRFPPQHHVRSPQALPSPPSTSRPPVAALHLPPSRRRLAAPLHVVRNSQVPV
ncbi:hypothetical protein R6Q59_017399 [Mikania micrantha]